MTLREFYTEVSNGNITDEMKDFATNGIAKIDADNEKRKAKAIAKKLENQPMIDAAVALLGSEPKTASDIKDALGVSVQKASALLRMAVAQGTVVQVDMPKKVKGYKLV